MFYIKSHTVFTFDLRTREGWEDAMTTLEMVHDCPNHGRTYGTSETECHLDWRDGCEQATYGPPCERCGYINYNIPQLSDELHMDFCGTDFDEPFEDEPQQGWPTDAYLIVEHTTHVEVVEVLTFRLERGAPVCRYCGDGIEPAALERGEDTCYECASL